MTFHAANICSDDFSQAFQMIYVFTRCHLFFCHDLNFIQMQHIGKKVTFFLSLILPLHNRPKPMKIGNAEENPDHKKAFVQELLKNQLLTLLSWY